MANPVIWLNIPVVIEVKKQGCSLPFSEYILLSMYQVQTATTIVYSLTIESPLSGWEGFFVQVNFPGPDGTVLELTTETQVIPDTYPTADCHNEGCFGTIV